MDRTTNILVVSDDFGLFEMIRGGGHSASRAVSFSRPDDDFVGTLKETGARIVLLDSPRPTEETVEFMKRIKKLDPLVDIIVGGEPLEEDQAAFLIKAGATDLILRPYNSVVLDEALRRIEEKRSLRKETFHLERKLDRKYNFQGMTSRNPTMLEVFGLIEGISRYFTTALIVGETGTGKEVAARAIHSLGPYKDKPFVICDCTSIPENLFESELFGYRKGAFTGADRDKRGLFEEAEGGIIFLDEIAEVPAAVQSKLLRVLESREFRPLGAQESRRVEVRVLAATNRDLDDMVSSGAFREDLFHRLNKVMIELPPLRERPEDITLLTRHFIQTFNDKFSKNVKGVSRDAQKVFLRYSWPGNIRELKNVIEGAAMLCRKDFLDIPDLPKYLREFVPASKNLPPAAVSRLSTLDDLEKEYITYLLKLTKGNLRKTAGILGISRTTLYNKIHKYAIPT